MAPLFESLEPRLLLSADFAGGFADPVTQEEAPAAILAPEGTVSQSISELAGEEQATPNSEAAVRHELVFIDTRTPDCQRLVDDLLAGADSGRQIEVVPLDAGRDGVA